jgi:hypothetical protein
VLTDSYGPAKERALVTHATRIERQASWQAVTPHHARSVSFRRVARAEQRVLGRTARTLAVLWTTGEHLADLIGQLANVIEAQAPPDKPDHYERAVAATLFIRSMQRAFILEWLDLARRHWSESLLKRRRAAELMAYAWICWKDPSEARKWLGASTDWTPYQEAFKPNRVRSALHELLPTLRKMYDDLSTRVHPSISSLVPAIRRVRPPVGEMYRIDLFDLRPYERAGLVQAVQAEHMLDTTHSTLALVRQFSTRAFSRSPWKSAARLITDPLSNVAWRLTTDARHHRKQLLALERFREQRRAESPSRPSTPRAKSERGVDDPPNH